jgi:hypothetical protein
MSQRSDDYRYTVDVSGTDVTPLAQVEAYFGTLTVRVHNISTGGMAVIFNEEPTFKSGEVLSISVSVRGRAFPVQIEIKNMRGFRVSCAFVEASPSFQASLREFLRPKFLGETMEVNPSMSGRKDVMDLVERAASYEAYLGQNQTGSFVWTDINRHLLKLVAVSRDLVFEWTEKSNIRTGRLKNLNRSSDDPNNKAIGASSEEGIDWHKNADITLIHYFADIFIPWLKNDASFVEKITSGLPLAEGEYIVFPKF